MLLTEDLQQLEEFFYEAAETDSKDKCMRAYPRQISLSAFVRGLVRLDRKVAKEAFGSFLDDKVFSTYQIRFVNFIIDHLTQNGTIAEYHPLRPTHHLLRAAAPPTSAPTLVPTPILVPTQTPIPPPK